LVPSGQSEALYVFPLVNLKANRLTTNIATTFLLTEGMFRAKNSPRSSQSSQIEERQVRRWVAMRDELDKINDMDVILTVGSTLIPTKTAIDSRRKCSTLTGSTRH
jgi:hypothetical protein